MSSGGLSPDVTEPLTPISIATAMADLERYLGTPAKVTQHVAGAQMGFTFVSELLGVDPVSIGICLMLRFANGVMIDLDLDESAAFIGGGGLGQDRWLELHVLGGTVALTIEDPSE